MKPSILTQNTKTLIVAHSPRGGAVGDEGGEGAGEGKEDERFSPENPKHQTTQVRRGRGCGATPNHTGHDPNRPHQTTTLPTSINTQNHHHIAALRLPCPSLTAPPLTGKGNAQPRRRRAQLSSSKIRERREGWWTRSSEERWLDRGLGGGSWLGFGVVRR
ncbi:hypothetical protein Droror1_Dr00026190 [Drosera rotundifolia]